MTLQDLHPLVAGALPEIVLVAGASFILLLGVTRIRGAAFPTAVLTLMLALAAANKIALDKLAPASGFLTDSLALFARNAAMLVALLLLLVNRHVPDENDQPEFFSLILFSIAGVTLIAVANDLILLFLALELVSVPTYILIGLSRRNERAQEATGKYFFLGAFAAALTLYGFSFLYGAAGTLQMFARPDARVCIADALASPTVLADKLTVIGLLLIIGGLLFKLAAAPMHFYVADVYQGAASPVTGLLGFVPKFAGFLALIRILSMAGWDYGDGLFWLLYALAAVTMLVGNTLALMQQNVKRMLAYSSVAHSGYMLVGLIAGPGQPDTPNSPLRNGLSAILFYLVVYAVMNLGAFAALAYLRKPDVEGEEDSAETLDDIAGCGRTQPWAALALAICTLGLMGFPPTAGFLGKFYVFSSAIPDSAAASHGTAMIGLIVFAVVNSAIAAAYYLRIIASCYLRQPSEGVQAASCGLLRAGLVLCALLVLLLFAKPGALLTVSRAAVRDVRGVAPAILIEEIADSTKHTLNSADPIKGPPIAP